MSKVAIVTDSNSGITQERGKRTWDFCPSDAIFYRWRTLSGGYHTFPE